MEKKKAQPSYPEFESEVRKLKAIITFTIYGLLFLLLKTLYDRMIDFPKASAAFIITFLAFLLVLIVFLLNRFSKKMIERIAAYAEATQEANESKSDFLANAVKFTPDGGRILLQAQLISADQLEFSVADSGIGIAEKDMQRLFTPFEQLDSSLQRKYKGTGLGLSMVKRLAELHGGTVSVNSELGKGSRFMVPIPLRTA